MLIIVINNAGRPVIAIPFITCNDSDQAGRCSNKHDGDGGYRRPSDCLAAGGGPAKGKS